MTAEEYKEFRDCLFKGEVNFVYKKVDGSERKARGTLKPELLPPPKPKIDDGVEKKFIKKRRMPEDTCCYWDLDAEGWRSFKIGLLQSFEPAGGDVDAGDVELVDEKGEEGEES